MEAKLGKRLRIVDNALRVVVTLKHVPTGLEVSSDPMLSDEDAKAQVQAKLAEALGTHTPSK